MGYPKGKRMTEETIKKRTNTLLKNKLKETKQKYFSIEIIGKFKSVVNWESLCLRKLYKEDRKRRAVKIKCGKCNKWRWLSYDNVIKQLNNPLFTGLCSKCSNEASWIDKGRKRPKKRKIRPDGYIVIWCPDHPMANKRGECLEHRLVMSEKLGRYLEPWENVHHINGIKNDNEPNNLELVINREHKVITNMEIKMKEVENRIICLENCLKKNKIRYLLEV